MSNHLDIGPRKTLFIFVVVVGCFSVLWPKVFYPILVGNAKEQMKPSPIDKTSGCCDVISDIDVNTIKIMIDLCTNIVRRPGGSPDKVSLSKEHISQCRKQILNTCGMDIEIILHPDIRIGHAVKRTLNEIRSLNGSLCLKYNFGLAPWKLGVPHRIVTPINLPNVRQERPSHMRPELLHPALREKGRAIPATSAFPPKSTLPRNIVDGRPGPIPGMRPPMGGAGGVIPPSTKGTSTMSVIMPIYTIGIVIFFTYTLMKLMCKKPIDSTTNGLYPPVEPDPTFREQVFESERPQYVSRHVKVDATTKLGWKERDTIVNAMSALLAEVDQQREEDAAKLRADRQDAEVIQNGNVANGTAVKPHDTEHDPNTVKVLGMETTASCEGGQKWSRPNSPMVTCTSHPTEPLPPPQSIYLEGALPAQSQLLVSESATEEELNINESNDSDMAVVLSGKMTLSVISLLENLPSQVENGTSNIKDITDEIDDDELIDEEEIYIVDEMEDDKLEESKYTTASNATAAENDISDEEDLISDGEQAEEIEED